MDEYSIVNTHEALKERLIDYIETAYFGKNDELRELKATIDACKILPENNLRYSIINIMDKNQETKK